MPHLTIEFTANLTPEFPANSALRSLNHILAASGHFEEADIKSRAVRLDSFAVGTASDARAFVHVSLAILSGRSLETRRALSEGLLQGLKQLCPCPAGLELQLSVEVRELERECYAKASMIA